jgi:hypothetical protein
MTVAVTESGGLQLSRNGVLFPPLEISDVQALYARIPDAEAAAARTTLTRIMLGLLGLLAAVPGLAADITIVDDTADITVNAATYAAIQALWLVSPDPATDNLVNGPVTVHTSVSTVVADVTATTWDALTTVSTIRGTLWAVG